MTTPHTVDPTPPLAPTRPHTWTRACGEVEDPYAWLRDRDDPETIAYLEAENRHADAWFRPHGALIEEIYGEIKSRTQETDVGVPSRRGPWWYVTRTEEGQAYPIYCRGRTAETATEQVLLDGNAEAAGRDYLSLGALAASADQRLLAWSADFDGSERFTLRVRDLDQGSDLDDRMDDTSAWGSIAWAGDDVLFYARHDEAMRPHQIWRHELGQSADADVLVIEEPDERFFVSVSLTRDERFVVIQTTSQTSGESRIVPADEPGREPLLLAPRQPDVEYSVEHWGDRFVILTNLDAEDYRVVTVPDDDPTGDWAELVATQPGRRITAAEPFSEHLVIHEWDRAQQRIRILRTDGSIEILDTGEEPHALELGDNPEYDSTVLRYDYASLTTPASVFDHDLVTGKRTLRKQVPTPGVDLTDYVAGRTWAEAHDGTAVPVDVVHHRDTPLDGTAPLVVYAYGSYEASLPPWFSVARLSLLDRGVVWALAHPRGGGELGRRWYLDGKLDHKRNTFTDTIAVAEHLVAEGFGAGDRLAVRGGSAGGLLVGACITMRPERWASAVAEVPFVDVVNTLHDPSLPLTVTEWEEWGDPRTEPMASYIESYSPYDQTVPADYPAVFVTAGLNDPRVSFHEPAKWVAKLRRANTGSRPIVFRCEMGAGHGGPSGRYESWRDEARVLTFLLVTLGRTASPSSTGTSPTQ